MSERLRTALIFAHECAPCNRPESTVGAQRPAQFAKYLPDFGWRAIVICCDYERRNVACVEDLADIERDAKRAIEQADSRASIIIPTPSLKWDGLLDRMWRAMSSNQTRFKSTRASVRKALTLAKFITGDYSQSWQPVARRAAEAIGESVKIDVCIGEHSPDAGIFLARWFSKKYGVPWVADFRDPILQPFKPFARRLYRPLARRLLRTTSGAINVNRVLADMDRKLFRCPAWAIPNGFDPDEFKEASQSARKERLIIAYTGNIIAQQRLEIFLEGLAQLRHLDKEAFAQMQFVYRGLAHERVARMTEAAGVKDAVDIGPRIDRESALSVVKNADLLLLLSIADCEKEDVYYSKGLYPAKAFEYFGARRPIICVPGDGGLLDDLIRETETGIVLRSTQEIARYILQAVSLHQRGEPLAYNPNEQAVSSYTRRNLSGRLADVLNSVAAPENAEAVAVTAKDAVIHPGPRY